jgi:hypothetical protein
MKAQKFTYTDLILTNVINPTFEPTVEQYAKAYIFKEDHNAGERSYIVTSKPYLWALALQRISRKELPDEKMQEVIKTAKKIRGAKAR